MTALRLTALFGLTVFAACGGSGGESTMGGMTAEEHARMQAGATQGAVDTTGAAVRQPVHLTAEQERALGVVYATVERQTLTRTIRTVGTVAAPEPGIADITPKIDGFVDRLYVSYTGEAVRQGQPLLALYSPMMVAAQEELLTARRLAARVDSGAAEAWRNAQATLAAARRRLSYWDISQEQIAQIERTGEITKTLTLDSPVDGIVLEKNVLEGQQVMPGMRLYRVADLSSVWAEGDLFEQDLQFVHVGSQAHIEVAAYPGQHLMGRVSFVYPTVDQASRTNRVRVTVPNPRLRLKPGMYTTIYFDVERPDVIAVPTQAVVVTGQRNLVFVRDAEGVLNPVEVVLGVRAGDRVQILSGLEEGQTIVAAANFLVDAESRLATTGSDMPGMAHGAGAAPAKPPTPKPDTMRMEHRHD
ncbi:MAG TPA: efflux RND transporter periplasmic adaptor subunit [Gemmatimonadales bacterium]|nr:efflux RND transporter periplasmic adaptor subunit [Gemmatimonadales bacterium]